MAGFRKAKAEQAALKIGFYGAQGSGKTFTALLIAEGLAQRTKKRVAYVDTEHGTDFYCKAVPQRAVHPDAFDFDALYTRSLTEIIDAVKGLDTSQYSVVVIDSMTHVWEAAKAAYSGRTTKIGTIPFQAWAQIKKPYKDLMSYLLSSPMHVLLCGRQGIEYETDEESEELKAVGYKMKAEGETPYEPHILIRMESVRAKKSDGIANVYAYAEKDRTGVLQGRTIENPNFDSLCLPLLGLLGDSQAHIYTEDEAAAIDAERLAEQESNKAEQSAAHLSEYSARITLAKTPDDLKAIGKAITKELKAAMLPADVAALRERFQSRETQIGNGGVATAAPKAKAKPPEDEYDPHADTDEPASTEGWLVELGVDLPEYRSWCQGENYKPEEFAAQAKAAGIDSVEALYAFRPGALV